MGSKVFFITMILFLCAAPLFFAGTPDQAAPAVQSAVIYGLTFQNNNSAIPKDAFGRLDALTKIIGESLDSGGKPGVEIDGYTDSDGAPEQNIKISWARAMSVMKYILDKFRDRGLTESDFTVKGLGATGFIGDNLTEEGRSRNRRIEVIVTGKSLITRILIVEAKNKDSQESCEDAAAETKLEAKAPQKCGICWQCAGLGIIDAGLAAGAVYEAQGRKPLAGAAIAAAGAAVLYTAVDYFWFHSVFPAEIKPDVNTGYNKIDGIMITAAIKF